MNNALKFAIAAFITHIITGILLKEMPFIVSLLRLFICGCLGAVIGTLWGKK